MERPISIVIFERLFWISTVIGAVGTYFAWPKMRAALAQSGSPYGMTTVVIMMLVFGAISIGLWYGIARRRNNIVRWIYIVWMGFGSISTLASLADPSTLPDTAMAFSLVSTTLILASIIFLFRSDTVSWIKGPPPVNSGIFR